jgi:cytochrome c553
MARFHMHENFELVRAIDKLIVSGKLDTVKSFAKAIAEAPDEAGLGPWAKQAALVRERAGALANTTQIDAAARLEGKLGEACAGCHVAAGVVPDFDPPPKLPPDRGDVPSRMTRHHWATDRLWEGMIGGDDDAWRVGLDILATTPLPALRLSTARAPLAVQLQELADKARKQRATLAERGATYGEILATCAACHAIP